MNKFLVIGVIGLFAMPSAAFADANLGGCGGYGKMAETKAPITTALKSGPITTKPATTKPAPKSDG